MYDSFKKRKCKKKSLKSLEMNLTTTENKYFYKLEIY